MATSEGGREGGGGLGDLHKLSCDKAEEEGLVEVESAPPPMLGAPCTLEHLHLFKLQFLR